MLNRFAKRAAQPNFRYAIALFMFSLAVNLACFNWAEAPVIYPDSHGYIKPAMQLKQGRLPDFSLRSPTYPMYLVVMGLFGKVVNQPPLKLAVYGQIVTGAISIVLLYFICLKLINRQWLAFGVSALLSLNFQVVNYQSAVLTETLATTLLLAVLYTHIAALHRKITLTRLCGMVTVDALLVMIRPSFILLPASLYGLHVLFLLLAASRTPDGLKSRGSSMYFLFLGILCNLALVTTWSALYYLQTGHIGLSRTSDFNLLGKAIQYGYLDQHYANPPKNVQRAQEIYRQVEDNQDPYSIINRLRSEGLYSLQNLRNINSYLLAGRRTDFVIKTGQLLPAVLNKRTHFYYGRPKGSYQDSWFRGFDLLNMVNGKAVVLATVVAFYLLIKMRPEPLMALGMIISSVLYHLLAITSFGYSEYSRLRSPIDLLLNVLVLLPLLFVTLYVTGRTESRRAERIFSR